MSDLSRHHDFLGVIVGLRAGWERGRLLGLSTLVSGLLGCIARDGWDVNPWVIVGEVEEYVYGHTRG